MSVVITGCNGFLGRLLVSTYKSELGEECHGLGTSSPENAPLHSLDSYRRLTLPSSQVASWIAEIQPRLVIHAAGRSSVPLSVHDPAGDFGAGPAVVFELLDAIRLHSPKSKFLFLSSAAVYGNPGSMPIAESVLPEPISPYGFHKLQSELIVREFSSLFGIRAASVRIFSAYGPGLRRQFLWDFCCKAVAGSGLVELQGTGAETRDFIYGGDVCRAIHCIESSAPLQGEAINICSGASVAISDLAHQLASHLHQPLEIRFSGHLPEGVPVQWQGEDAVLRSMGFVANTTLDAGVRRYADWFLSFR